MAGVMTARKPAALLPAAQSDDRLRALKALRDRLAVEIEGCDSKRDMAALSLRFMDVVGQIAELSGAKPVAPKKTGLSEFEVRLRERESAAKAAHSASG